MSNTTSRAPLDAPEMEMVLRSLFNRTRVESCPMEYSASTTAPPGSLKRISWKPLCDRRIPSIAESVNSRSSAWNNNSLCILLFPYGAQERRPVQTPEVFDGLSCPNCLPSRLKSQASGLPVVAKVLHRPTL